MMGMWVWRSFLGLFLLLVGGVIYSVYLKGADEFIPNTQIDENWNNIENWKADFLEASFRPRYCAQREMEISFIERISIYFNQSQNYFAHFSGCNKNEIINKWHKDIVISRHPVEEVNLAIEEFIKEVNGVFPYHIILSDKAAEGGGDILIHVSVPSNYMNLYEASDTSSRHDRRHTVICGRSLNCTDLVWLIPKKFRSGSTIRGSLYGDPTDRDEVYRQSINFSSGVGYQVDGSIVVDKNNFIQSAQCLIPLYYSDHIQFAKLAVVSMVKECLLRSLGFPSVIPAREFSVLRERKDIFDFGYISSITPLDKKLLATLYQPSVTVGESKSNLTSWLKKMN